MSKVFDTRSEDREFPFMAKGREIFIGGTSSEEFEELEPEVALKERLLKPIQFNAWQYWAGGGLGLIGIGGTIWQGITGGWWPW